MVSFKKQHSLFGFSLSTSAEKWNRIEIYIFSIFANAGLFKIQVKSLDILDVCR